MSQVALNFRCSEQKFKLFCNSFGTLFNPLAPEPPVTARADPGPFYPLWRHQF